MSSRWSRFDDLVATLRKRWDSGRYLRAYASGDAWEPVALPVKAPTAAELLADFDEVILWAERFRRDSSTAAARPRVRVEYRVMNHKSFGANEFPARIRVDSFEELAKLLGAVDDVRRLDLLLDRTARDAPALVPWVASNPGAAIAHHAIWADLLATVCWISEHNTSELYLRHIDVAGVDTKFVERHNKILRQLLDATMPADRVDTNHSDLVRRFGFRAKPDYTRFRLLAPVATVPSGITELRLRTDELAHSPIPLGTVFVVENEISYLAFPAVPDAIVIFGEGFHLTVLESLSWLHDRELVYWGDIDTHGFAILSRLRARFPRVASILMDRETLLAHPGQYVTEPTPTSEHQPNLTEPEQSLYQDLVEDRYGESVRLEQERVRFSLVRQALRPWLMQEVKVESPRI